MSAALARRTDYRTDAAKVLRDRVHADLRHCLSGPQLIAQHREAIFWSAWEIDFTASVEGLRHG